MIGGNGASARATGTAAGRGCAGHVACHSAADCASPPGPRAGGPAGRRAVELAALAHLTVTASAEYCSVALARPPQLGFESNSPQAYYDSPRT